MLEYRPRPVRRASLPKPKPPPCPQCGSAKRTYVLELQTWMCGDCSTIVPKNR